MENSTGMNNEKWVNDVMNSTTGVQRAVPPDGLYEKISLSISNPKKTTIIPFPVKHWAAAAMFLLAVNIGSAIYAIGQGRKSQHMVVTNPIAAEIQLQSTYNY